MRLVRAWLPVPNRPGYQSLQTAMQELCNITRGTSSVISQPSPLSVAFIQEEENTQSLVRSGTARES